MQSLPSWVLPIVAVTGFVLVIGVLVARQATSACGLFAPPRESPPVSSSTLPEEHRSSTPSEQRIVHADDATFADLVLKSEVPVLVDFYADWCGPCRQLAPVLEELASETPGARIVKVDVDRSPALATEYGVDSIPSLKVFKNGTVTDELVGLASKNELRAMLTR